MSVLPKELREQLVRICDLEREPEERVPTGWPEFDRAIGGGLARHGVHEWFALGDRTALRLPPMGVLIELAWRALACEARDRRRRAVWIGRACHPPAQALVKGLRGVIDGRRPQPDATLLDRSIFVDAHAPSERAWAIEQAVRCSGVFVVIADGAGFDAALSRRVQLAAAGQSLMLLARPERERTARSVAMTRWLVEPCADGADEDTALEWPWKVSLLRSKQGGADFSASTWSADRV